MTSVFSGRQQTKHPNKPTSKSNLPNCKVRRNYSCSQCVYFTQNPRHYLYHLRDEHESPVKIHECPRCLYASRHLQKLCRHVRMVHDDNNQRFVEGEEMVVNASVGRPRGKKRSMAMVMATGNDDGMTGKTGGGNGGSSGGSLRCSVCSFSTRHQSQLTRHERAEHIKTKFFRCSKCSYVTHIKARFTKHVKYHSMPMIKCDLCDFRTPYKWNLDRHYKNHNGHGAFRCSACNFTADIKQSLTVHEMNHHVPPVGHAAGLGVGRRRNKVGASDTTALEENNHSFNVGRANAEHQLDQVSADLQDTTKLKISIKKAKQQEESKHNNFGTDFIHPDDIIHHSNGNIYIKNKCRLCNYKSAWDTEMQRHEQKIHGIAPATQRTQPPPAKKIPRPVPNLIPIQTRPQLTQKDMHEICAKSVNSSLRDFASLIGADEEMFGPSDDKELVTSTPKPDFANKKNNASFFDRLKEKLMTDAGETLNLTCKWCGHESKCLSELAGHQKTCGKEQISSQISVNYQNTSSTRCQHCRQRCKSSADLLQHLRLCTKLQSDEKPNVTIKLEEPEPIHDDSQEPHPMENVVFVWNDISGAQPQDNSLETPDFIAQEAPKTAEIHQEQQQSYTTPTKMPTHGNDLDLVAEGKRVFKCPHCSFWASTASRFHVHIVGHLNKKPFECSLCAYRSNWRWDITKHIRLKSVRDPAHEDAKVLMTDETGRRNYSKYNKYLTQLRVGDGSDSGKKVKSTYDMNQGRVSPDQLVVPDLPKLVKAPNSNDFGSSLRSSVLRPPPPLKSPDGTYYHSFGDKKKMNDNKKTMFKCKKCNFRDPSRETILIHVKAHYEPQDDTAMTICDSTAMTPPPQLMSSVDNCSNAVEMENNSSSDEASVITSASATRSVSAGVQQAPFRCGHCHQVSNWKHVIQRHCRLKHSGDVRVVIGGKNGTTEKIEVDDQTDEPDHIDIVQDGAFKCKNCPYSTNIEPDFEKHIEMHTQRIDATIKCYFCSFFVTQKYELFEHLKLHGVQNPEDYVNRASVTKLETSDYSKRYRCVSCPYLSNSKSQFLYHKQFHKPRNAQFKCEHCSYNVSRRHLLHQHLRVHGIIITPQKLQEFEAENEPNDYSDIEEISPPQIETQQFTDVPLVWVSKNDQFTKMYKCRYCPHVNMRKVNIQEHEKMHGVRNCASPKLIDAEHHCTECNYMCNNAGVLSSHAKVHQGVYGKIHCLVDVSRTDEEQIEELTKLLGYGENVDDVEESGNGDEFVDLVNEECGSDIECVEDQDCITIEITEPKYMLYFCEHCPARFRSEKEFHIHNRFHGVRLFYKCEYCTYTSRQKPHLLTHNRVHTEEYQEGTRTLLSEIPVHPDHPQPRTAVIVNSGTNGDNIWVVISGISNAITEKSPKISNKNFACKKCPARFFKNELLNYHMTLHGCSNPYKCRICDYAARTSSNLQKHEKIHEKPTNNIIEKFPISGTELFVHKSHVLNEFKMRKNKKYKCEKCPTTFEKREQYKIHTSLHGSKQKYKCKHCDYSVKYYANYVQHLRKHKQTIEDKGVEEPQISYPAIKSLNSPPKGGPIKLSIADKQTLMILQQRRNSNASSCKETTMPNISLETEKKSFSCTHCPYSSYRKDAVDNHLNRHISVSGNKSNYTCDHCDYTVPQTHFLRDHVKLHFAPSKNIGPESYMSCKRLKLTGKSLNGDSNTELLFEDRGKKFEAQKRFVPEIGNDGFEADYVGDNKVFVNRDTGEVIVDVVKMESDTKDVDDCAIGVENMTDT